jgi:hypothetical protein
MAVEGLLATGPPNLPVWFFFLRIGLLVLSFGTFIAACVNVSAFNDWAGIVSSAGPGGFIIFDAIFTWIVIGSMLLFEWKFHNLFLRIAYVVLLPLGAIFWLSAWAWAASVASAFRSIWTGTGSSNLDKFSASIAACAALGAFTWIAFVAVTIFYIVACLSSRSSDPESGVTYQAEMAVPKQDLAGTTAVQGAPYVDQHQQQQQQQSPYPAQEIPQYPPQQYPPQQQQQ